MQIKNLPPLPPESRQIAERAINHINRCELLAAHLGGYTALLYHERHRNDPGSDEAEQDFFCLLERNN